MIFKSNTRKLAACSLAFCIVFSTLGFQACPKGQSDAQKTTYRKIGEASDDIANGVEKVRLALKAMQRAGKISRDEANVIRVELINLSDISGEYTKLIKKHRFFTPEAKRETDVWVEDLKQLNIRLVENGVYHIKNEEAKSSIATSVAVISTAISTIATLVSQLKTEQSK